MPVEPDPVEPAPVEPAPVEPGLVEPLTVNILLVEPVPADLPPVDALPGPRDRDSRTGYLGRVTKVVRPLSRTAGGPRMFKGIAPLLPLDGLERGALGAWGPKLSVAWARPRTHAFLLISEAMA